MSNESIVTEINESRDRNLSELRRLGHSIDHVNVFKRLSNLEIIITVIYIALFQVDQSANTILISEINEFLVFSKAFVTECFSGSWNMKACRRNITRL